MTAALGERMCHGMCLTRDGLGLSNDSLRFTTVAGAAAGQAPSLSVFSDIDDSAAAFWESNRIT